MTGSGQGRLSMVRVLVRRAVIGLTDTAGRTWLSQGFVQGVAQLTKIVIVSSVERFDGLGGS